MRSNESTWVNWNSSLTISWQARISTTHLSPLRKDSSCHIFQLSGSWSRSKSENRPIEMNTNVVQLATVKDKQETICIYLSNYIPHPHRDRQGLTSAVRRTRLSWLATDLTAILYYHPFINILSPSLVKEWLSTVCQPRNQARTIKVPKTCSWICWLQWFALFYVLPTGKKERPWYYMLRSSFHRPQRND